MLSVIRGAKWCCKHNYLRIVAYLLSWTEADKETQDATVLTKKLETVVGEGKSQVGNSTDIDRKVTNNIESTNRLVRSRKDNLFRHFGMEVKNIDGSQQEKEPTEQLQLLLHCDVERERLHSYQRKIICKDLGTTITGM